MSGKEDDGWKPERRTKCNDCGCVVVFFLFWAGMILIAANAFANGDFLRLIFATDHLGNTCASPSGCGSNRPCPMNIYYPRVGLDAMVQDFDPFATIHSEIKLFGICVDSCPQLGDFVCTYAMQARLLSELGGSVARVQHVLQVCQNEMNIHNRGVSNRFGLVGLSQPCAAYMENCWYVAQPQTSFLFRCVPEKVDRIEESAKCFHPAHQNENETLDMPSKVCTDEQQLAWLPPRCDDSICRARTGSDCVENNRCIFKMTTTTTQTVLSSVAGTENILVTQLSSWTTEITRNIGDIQHTWYTLLTSGVLCSICFGFIWLRLLQSCIKPLVYGTIYLAMFAMVGFSLISFAKAGKFESEEALLLDLVNGTFLESGTASIFSFLEASNSSDETSLWNALGIFSAVLACIYLLVLLVLWRQIQIALAIYAEASVAVQQLKLLVLFPFFTSAATLILLLYSGMVFANLFTAGRLNVSNLTFSPDMSGVGDVMVSSLEFDAASTGLLVYHVFGHFWTQQVVQAVSVTTIAGCVSSWYWTRDKEKVLPSELFKALKRSLVDYFGSLVFGSLFVAVVQLIRTVFYYIERRTKRIQQTNMVVRVIFRVIDCCLRCFERILKFITRQAFVMIAIQGLPFCASTKEAVGYISRNIGRIAVVNFIGSFVMLLFKLAIVASAVAIEWAWLNAEASFQTGGERELHSQVLSLFLTALLSYWIATAFTHVYSVTVDTIVLCFCIDVDKNRESRKYFMRRGLRKFFASQKKKRRKGKAEKEQRSTSSVPEQTGQLKTEKQDKPQENPSPSVMETTSATVVPT